MKGQVKEVWVIVECPHCKRPLTLLRSVVRNKIVNFNPGNVQCIYCDQSFPIELKGEYK